MKILLFFLLLCILVLAGCQQPEIIVHDERGTPIAEVEIVGVSLSIQGQSTLTNVQGEASIPSAAQPTKWVVAKKAGYQDSRQISVDTPKPIVIILKKVSG